MPPRIQKDIYLSVGGELFAAKVGSSEIASPKPVVWRGGDSATVYSEVPVEGTVLNVGIIQDWEDADGICRYLQANAGEQAEIIFSPRSAGTAYFKVSAILQTPAIGGKMNVYGESTLALECVSAVEVMSAPVVTTTSLSTITHAVAFSQQLVASGSTATWAVTTGTLPSGLTLSASGLLSGTVASAASYSFTVTATNVVGSDTQAYSGSVV